MSKLRLSLRRRLIPGLLALGALGAAAGCSPSDPCASVEGTCLSLRLLGEGDVTLDAVQLSLTGPVGLSHRFSRDVPGLPALLPLQLTTQPQGELAISAVGTHESIVSARGELQVPVQPGQKQALELTLRAYTCGPGGPPPCPPDPSASGLQLSGLTPAGGPTSGGTVVSVTGAGLQPGAKVSFGGALSPVVEWRSASELAATAPARPAQLGPVDVTVQNPDGLSGTLSAAFRYFASLFSVEAKPDIKLPANTTAPFSLAVADLDGDGKQDVVVANRDSNTLTLLFGKGDGSFENPSNLMGNELNRAAGVTVLDVNGDQKLDLVVASEFTGALLLYLGNGTRNGFQTNTAGNNAVRIPFSGVAGVTAGNFDNDGKTDLFMFSNGGSMLAVAPNKGPSGGVPSFGDPNDMNNRDVFEKPVAIVVTDLDGDQRDDVIAIGQPGNNNNNLGLTLSKSGSPKKAYRATCVLAGVAVVDLDGDGKKDVAATCNDTGQIALWKGKGGVDLENPIYLRTGLVPHSIAAADLDLDGRPDLAVTMKRYGMTNETQDPDSSHVYFLINSGDGKLGFRPPQSVVVGRGPAAIAVTELDRDGQKRPDVVVSSAYGMGTGLLSVLLNTSQ